MGTQGWEQQLHLTKAENDLPHSTCSEVLIFGAGVPAPSLPTVGGPGLSAAVRPWGSRPPVAVGMVTLVITEMTYARDGSADRVDETA